MNEQLAGTPISHVRGFQLAKFPLARYPEQLFSDSTAMNFEIIPSLARKNLTNHFNVQPDRLDSLMDHDMK